MYLYVENYVVFVYLSFTVTVLDSHLPCKATLLGVSFM